MVQQMQLPPGLTEDMLRNIAQYFANQPIERPRPTGKLPANMIRGVNPRYQHQHREYPKALQPPDVVINNEMEERDARAQWQQALPWADAPSINAYFAYQKYPKVMAPPQVLVYNQEEEDAKLASWRITSADRIAYPRWMFHPRLPAVMVKDVGQEVQLGDGWYATPDEALQAAAGKTSSQISAREVTEHEQLIARAAELGLTVDRTWTVEKLQKAITANEKKSAKKAA